MSNGATPLRTGYLRRLRVVHDDLLRMGSRVEHALADAMRALASWDTDIARNVVTSDHAIDLARTTIEESVLQLFATQQPVLATDVRTLASTIAIVGELERAGDYAKGIARRVGRCLAAPALVDPPIGLHAMGSITQAMLHTCLDAFVRLDVPLARSLATEDERVDALEDRVVAELLCAARQDPIRLDCAIYLLDIAHTLERLADRTTNIAERIIFIATSKLEQLNP